MALHCPECGFVNVEGANFCQKCGTLLTRPEGPSGEPITATYRVAETGELIPIELDDALTQGPTLVIRAGGGRVGESFALSADRMTVGRGPDADLFLDDVTVSRHHALLIRRGDDYFLDDCGSLNGTYVNRSRIESQRLEHGDELQIGKYKLVFLAR
jgi:hypothetical protein